MDNIEKSSKLIDTIFSQGDSRYLDNYNGQTMLNFILNSAVKIEIRDIPYTNTQEDPKIKDPQKEFKYLAKHLFKEFGIELIGFEKRVAFGIADVLGRKHRKTILVECGPCRIDKGFNYLRKENLELWILTQHFDPGSDNMEDTKLYIIKRGPNWQNTIQNHDRSLHKAIRKVRLPSY